MIVLSVTAFTIYMPAGRQETSIIIIQGLHEQFLYGYFIFFIFFISGQVITLYVHLHEFYEIFEKA
jgi:hypothetical protein